MKEKGPYETKAEKRKAEYEKQMKVYNKKQVNKLHYCFFISSIDLFDLVMTFFFFFYFMIGRKVLLIMVRGMMTRVKR